MTGRERTRTRHDRRAGERGFTLVELTVSLVAGLIVALGIVSLSKEASRTFHEEVRSAAAEAGLRTAVDRLRADLGRAGYMSTGNIMTDPLVAKPQNLPSPKFPASMAGLQRLSAIYLMQGGSATNNAIPLSAVNGLTPDIIDIGGNMTSNDQFEVQVVNPPVASCQRLNLSAVTPAMYRVTSAGAAAAALELRNLFQPVAPTSTTQFIVRIVDDTGCTQYVATCKGTAAASIDTTGPYVMIDSTDTPLQTALTTGTTCGYTGLGSGKLWVNPVQIVRWEVASATAGDKVPAQYVAALNAQPSDGTIDPLKYDLLRSFVDVTGNVVAETSEVVAEYAVDLDVAFSVETGTNLQPKIVTYPFNDTVNTPLWAQNVSTQALPATTGPQRIRSIRARVATRTAQSDRAFTIPVPNPPGSFLYRYCMLTAGCSGTNLQGALQYARVRTMTLEVAVPNSSRNYY